MSITLKLLVTVIKRRIASGEAIEDILLDYPKLTQQELEEVLAAI